MLWGLAPHFTSCHVPWCWAYAHWSEAEKETGAERHSLTHWRPSCDPPQTLLWTVYRRMFSRESWQKSLLHSFHCTQTHPPMHVEAEAQAGNPPSLSLSLSLAALPRWIRNSSKSWLGSSWIKTKPSARFCRRYHSFWVEQDKGRGNIYARREGTSKLWSQPKGQLVQKFTLW